MDRRSVVLCSLVGLSTFAACSERATLDRGSANQPAPTPGELTLRVESPAEVSLGLFETTALVVRALYGDSLEPAQGVEVRWTVVGETGGAALQLDSAVTLADGRSSNRLTAGGSRARFAIFVTATSPTGGTRAPPGATIWVETSGSYVGDLRVGYAYDGLIPLSELDTRLHAGPLNCAQLVGRARPSAIARKVVRAPEEEVTFSNLIEDGIYTLTVWATGPTHDVVARGCVIAEAIVGRAITDVVVDLQLDPVRVVGSYDFAARLDLTETLPAHARQVIDGVDAFFRAPAAELGNWMAAELAQRLTGGDEAELARWVTASWAVYAAVIAEPPFNPDVDQDGVIALPDVVQYLLLDRSPAWVEDGLLGGGDITRLLTELEVGGVLELTGFQPASGAVVGSWDWSSFLWRWRASKGCDPNDACCGRVPYQGYEMGLTPVASALVGTLEAPSSTWQPAMDLRIDEHRLELHYGRLIRFAVERFALPATTGQSTFSCAVESLMGCEPGGTFVCGDPVSSAGSAPCGCGRAGAQIGALLGVGTEAGEAACALAVAAAAAGLEEELAQLTWGGASEAYLTVEVRGRLADEDLDLQLDSLSGSLTGALRLSRTVSSFGGPLRGSIQRDVCAADGDCDAQQACRAVGQVLDDCAGQLVCMHAVGTGAGGDACGEHDACRSGLCLSSGPGGTCFSPCTDDFDCEGSISCSEEPLTLSLGDEAMQARACGL